MDSDTAIDTLSARYQDEVEKLRQYFAAGNTRPRQWRLAQLDALARLITDNESAISEALAEDLDKPLQEVLMGETALILSEIRHARRHLRAWMRSRKVWTPAVGQPGSSWVQPEPLGVVLIIGAWNYPVQLLLAPLIPALAAGNCAVLKPSEVAAASSALMARLVPEYLDSKAVTVVEGAVDETTALLRQRFDHIFYTGGAAVGRIVMKAAAEYLTPVTLELGGKSPCVVDDGADLASAARRIAWGKCLNAGQTCIAPDYVLVDKGRRDALIAEIGRAIETMYGEQPLESPDFAAIINDRHYQRLKSYLDAGQVAIGGQSDDRRRRIAPTVLTDVDPNAEIMREEIFGPILPVLDIDNLGQAIDIIRQGEKPLAAYLFSGSRDNQRRFSDQVSSGSLCINDVIMFMSVPDLPFGGVGQSGMGQYHGRAGFDRLSHLKSVMKRARWPEVNVRFAPYSQWKMRLLKWLA